MINDTSFQTARQQETKDFILELRRLIAEKDAEIERLKAIIQAQKIALEGQHAQIAELRKAAE